MFNAAYGDDQDALTMALEGFPELLLVRQDRKGQRASLAHAAAAGGAVRVAPSLMLAMHAAALQQRPTVGAAAAAAAAAAAEDPAAAAAAKLRAAVGYCCGLRDVLGRTPLHFAARAGQLGFVKWAIALLSTEPKAASAIEASDALGLP